MAADFNAGSIEGTLDLRTSPFYAGLTKARKDADEFEKKKITPDLGLDAKEFKSGVAASSSALKTLDKQKAKPEVELGGVASTLGAIGLIRAALAHLGGTKTVGGGALTSMGFMLLKFGGLAAGVLALTAALGPATSALVAFATAGVAAMGPLIFSFGLFGATVTGAVKQIMEANKAGERLTGWAGKAQKSMKEMSGAWKDFKKELAPQTFGFLITVFEGLAGVLPKLVPLTRAVTVGMTGLVEQIFALTERPVFERFLEETERFMTGFLKGAGPILVDLTKGFMRTFHQMLPVLSLMGDALGDWAEAFRRFTRDGGGMERWVQNMLTWLPMLGDLVGSVWRAFESLFHGLSPLAAPALLFLTDLFEGLAQVDLGPLVQLTATFLATLTAAGPALGIVGNVLNSILRVFNSLPSDVQTTVIQLGIAVVLFNKLTGLLGSATTAVRGFGTASAVAGTQAAAAGGKAAAAATRMQRFGAMARQAAGPLGLGLLIHSSSMADGKMKTLTATAGAAAIGFAVAGPLGAAVAGMATLFARMTRKFKEADIVLDGLAGSLNPVNQAMTKLSREIIVGTLVQQDAYDAADRLGIKHGDLTKAALGNEAAMKRVRAAFSDASKQDIRDTRDILHVLNQVGLQLKDAQKDVQLYREQTFRAGKELKGKIPKELLTKIKLAEFPRTMEDLAKLTHKFKGLSDKQIKLLIKVFGLDKFATDLDNGVKQVRWWENIVSSKLRSAGNTKPSRKWLDLLVGDLGHGKRVTETGVLGINNIINKKTGEARPNLEPFSRALIGDLKGLEARAGSGGEKIGSAMANGISASLRNALNKIVFGATWLVDQALGAARAAAGAGPGPQSGPAASAAPGDAEGGVTRGPRFSITGDNPGGQEAIIPLNEYDVPRKGDLERIASRGVETDSRIISLLAGIYDLLGKSPGELAEALDGTLSKHSDASLKKAVMAVRSA